MGVFNPMDVNAPANQRRQQLVQKLMQQYRGSTHALGSVPGVRPVGFAATASGGGMQGFMSQLHGGGGMQGGATQIAPGAHFLSGYTPGAGIPVINWADVFRGGGNRMSSIGDPGVASSTPGNLPSAPIDVPQDIQTSQPMGQAVAQATGPSPAPSSPPPMQRFDPVGTGDPTPPVTYPSVGPGGLLGKAAQQWYAFHFGGQ